jgi:peroxiredoxin
MKRFLFAPWVLLAIALPSTAALNQGDPAPHFTARASRAGETFDFSLADALKKGPVVVYFFPAAFTSVCNVQAHEFAQNEEKFVAAGATVVGVSLDSIARLNEFSADPNYCGGKVAVAADVDGGIAKSYDLKVLDAPPGSKDSRGIPIEHGLVESFTFVIAPDGKIAAAIGGGRSPSANVIEALKAVQKLSTKQTAAKSPSARPEI